MEYVFVIADKNKPPVETILIPWFLKVAEVSKFITFGFAIILIRMESATFAVVATSHFPPLASLAELSTFQQPLLVVVATVTLLQQS